jgi:hypothetical protein
MKSQIVCRILICLATATVFLFAGCKASHPDPFPASGEVKGWEKTDDTRTFAAKDLWQYLDGDSEQYVQAGVVSTSTTDYRYGNQLEAVVDVHTMRDAAGAQHILESGRGPDAQLVSLGDAGFAYTQSIVFRKGHTLIRIIAYQSIPETQQALQSLARGIEARI